MTVVKDVVEAVKKSLPKRRPIEHHEVYYDKPEINHISGCMGSGLAGTKFVDQFQEKLCQITGANYVVAMASGTAALHIALVVSGVQPGEEVILQPSTFSATANAIYHAGAFPHFVDAGFSLSGFKLNQYLTQKTKEHPSGTGRLNVKTGRKISAILPVHLMGHPSDMEKIVQTANKFGLTIVEDAAAALGSRIKGKHCGLFGSAGVISFNTNKIATTNGGGALITNDPWIAAKAYQLSNVARVNHPWYVATDEIAWNYRMGNLNAAFGLGQLEHFDKIIANKVKLTEKYMKNLHGIEGVKMPVDHTMWGGTTNNWLVTITVGKHRNELLEALHAEGIKARALFTPLHTLPQYKDCPTNSGAMLESEHLFERAVCLPSGAGLIEET